MNYQCRGLGEYLVHSDVINDSNHIITYWMNRRGINHVSSMELKLKSSNVSDFIKDSGIEQNINPEILKIPRYQPINLGTRKALQIIQIYDDIKSKEKEIWMDYFLMHKTAFA